MNETTPSTSLLRAMRPEVARRRIEFFGRRFGEAHLYLAYHAAFPLAITPDLLYRLWANFPRNIHGEPLKIPWVAVADLLLSSLCNEVGHELYEMNVTLRAELLSDLKANPNFGDQRITELSGFLLAYIQQQLNSSDPNIRNFAQAQQWTALAYTKPGEAVQKLALALRSSLEQNDKAEQLRMASLIETFAEPLAGFAPLLTYACGVGYLTRGDIESARTQFSEVARGEEVVEVEGVRLQLPVLIGEKTSGVSKGNEQKRPILPTNLSHKLLVITAGTIAAGVGLELMKQIKAHPASELQPVVRYIDTAHLPTRYSGLRSGEWFQMTINPQFMDTIRRNQENYPHLKDLLYPGFLPEIQGSGGGSIRYNAAGAIAINRNRMKEWLTTSITDLIKSGGGQVDLSIALVVSAVGATGSGTLERLIDIIVDCAQNASIPPPLHCDVFILQPGMQGVTDLGLSNTLALYAEMAASRLSRNNISSKSYRGRTIMVGWGSERYMASIEQLLEATATLVRLTHDPATDIAAEFQEREVDNHVLREQDWQTQLPSHLSSATVVTISLGDLEEKIIQRDAVRLIDMLVFGGKPSETATGEYFIPGAGKTERQSDPLLGTLTSFLQGKTPEDRYRHLIERLTEGLSLSSLQTTATQLKDMPVQQQASRLRSLWQFDKEEIAKRGRQTIQGQGATLAGTALNEIIHSRRKAMATGLSLRDLRDEYQQMEDILTSTLEVQQDSSQGAADTEVIRKINALERAVWGKERALQQALGAVHGKLEQTLRRESHTAAIEVLKLLQNHCAESLRNLEIVLQKLLKQRKNNPKWAAADQEFRVDMNHLLHIAALSTPGEITRYADLVSIFASQNRRREGGGTIGRIVAGEEQKIDQLAAFRKWLDDQRKLDALFEGEIDKLLELAQNYARTQVHKAVFKHSILDVLLQADESVLLQGLREAQKKAYALVQFDKSFARNLHEKRHVSAYWRTLEQRNILERAITKTFGQECTLLSSKDPTEIVVFYYVDGLPMSAVTDLTGRCLEAFLNRRRSWNLQSTQTGNRGERYNQRVGVPVYSGMDAEQRVLETDVIRRLYKVRGKMIDAYTSEEIPELTNDLERFEGGR